MLITLFIFAFILFTVFVCGIAIGRKGRELLRLELSNLRGKHETLAESYQDMKRIAGEALETARKKHFPANLVGERGPELIRSGVRGTYLPPTEKHCPECSVSVRSDSWPQECPACHSVFGFDE